MAIFATDPDESSIMCYQVPGSCTKDGKPITGGSDINDTDYWFAGRIYPKANAGRALQPDSSTSVVPFEEEHHADDSEVDLTQYTLTPLDL